MDTTGNIIPGANNAQEIGSSSFAWKTIYVNSVIPNSTGTQGYWQRNDNSISPTNITDDLLLGATATSSAKFAFINVAGGTPTASISAGATGLILSAEGSIQALQNGNLLLGGDTTGDITLSPLNGAGTVTSTGSFRLSTGKTYQIGGTDVLSATTLGSSIINSSLTSVGTLTSGTWTATAVGTQYGGTGQDFSSVAQGAIPFFSATGVMSNLAAGIPGQCLVTAGSGSNPIWTDCTSGSNTTNWWNQANGSLTPINNNVDLLLGSDASSSAKFAILYISIGTPTASISATSTGTGVVTSGDGSIQSLEKGTLTIGGTTTGDIQFKPGDASSSLYLASNGNVGIG
ncbi:MAG TPA: hypothetical protein V6C65_05600, partial [Allocoleopsis sp.]